MRGNDGVVQDIRARGYELAERILGAPERVAGPNAMWRVPWRQDNRPSLAVLRTAHNGHEAGFWRDFARDESGDALSLLARVRGLDIQRDFPRVKEEACAMLGIALPGTAEPQLGATTHSMNATNARRVQALDADALGTHACSDNANDGSMPSTRRAGARRSQECGAAALAASYGLQWSDFAEAGCEFRGDKVVYPVLLGDGTIARKFKSVARDSDGKRASWGERGSRFQHGLFLARPDVLAACREATLVVAEGEEKAIAASVAGKCAASPANGARGLSRDAARMISEAMPARVVIAFDADEAGREGAAKSAKLLHDAGVRDVLCVQWADDAAKGRDVTDVLVEEGIASVCDLVDGAVPGTAEPQLGAASHSMDATDAQGAPACDANVLDADACAADANDGSMPPTRRAGARRSQECAPGSPPPSSPVLPLVGAADLVRMKFPPMQWIVEGFLPPGIALLCADPKVGKSRLATRIAMHVSAGTPMWGRDVRAGDCLLVSMEEPLEALQDRMMRLQPQGQFSNRLSLLAFDFPAINDGGLAALDAWARSVEQPRLVVLDTWAHVRGEDRSRADAYTRDVQALKPLQQWCARWPGLSLLLIHHYRKGDGAHWTHKSNGSVGMIGGADVVLGMSRDGRKRAKLQGIGRRVCEFAWMLRSDDVSWELEGDAEEAEKEAGMGEFQSQVLEYLREHDYSGPTEIAKALGSDKGTTGKALSAMMRKGVVESSGGKWRTAWDGASQRCQPANALEELDSVTEC